MDRVKGVWGLNLKHSIFFAFFKNSFIKIYSPLISKDRSMPVLTSRLMCMLIPGLLSRGETDKINKQDKRRHKKKKNQYEAKILQDKILKPRP